MGVAVLSKLTEVRAEVVSALEAADFKATEFIGERISPPLAVVVPDDVYIDLEGAPFGHVNVNMLVGLVSGKGTNKATSNLLDDMIERAYLALEDHCDIVGVSAPGETVFNGHSYLGASLAIRQTVRL